MKIQRRIVSPYQTNCYLLIDEATNAAALIDPGDEGAMLCQWVKDQGAELRYILITHGHRDHTGGTEDVKKAFPDAKVYVHSADDRGAGFYVYPLVDCIDDLCYYDDGDTLPLGELTVKVLHTPGHTEGGITLMVGDVLFTGDTLFAGSMGRTDFPGGSAEKIYRSLYRLGSLVGDYRVFPGHMDETTLERERRRNSYLRFAMGEKDI